MRSETRLTLLLLAATLALPAALEAQRRERPRERDREDWLEDCRDGRWGNDDRERWCEQREMGWRNPGASLTVDASPNGGVEIEGWDRDSVHVLVRIQAAAPDQAEARQIASEVRVTRRGDELLSDGPDGLRRRRWWMVTYVIYAPRRTDLTLSTVNGPIAVADMNSRMDLRVQNGPLSLVGVGGDVTARAQNGPLHVELSGTRWEGARLDASTQNGPVVLEVPEGYNAELETGTINGPMTLGFPITVQGRIGPGRQRHLTTTLGQGGALVRAVTTNGPAVVRRS